MTFSPRILCALMMLSCPIAADPAVLQALPEPSLQPEPQRYVSGRLDSASLERLRQAGIRHIINISPAAETPDWDEAQQVQAAGMHYHPLPVVDAADLTLARAQQLDTLLQQIGDAPVVLHCASGNRVGALMALRAAWIHGAEPQQALRTGQDWGMTRLTPAVQQLLRQGPR